MNRWSTLGFAIAITSVMLTTITSRADEEDKITFSNVETTEDFAFMLDGVRDGERINDVVYKPAAANQSVGNMQKSDWDEIAVFQKRRMVGIHKGGWSDGADERAIELVDEKSVDLVIWFVSDTSAVAINRATWAAGRASVIWTEERVGLKLGKVTLRKDKVYSVPSLERIHCTTTDCREGANLKTQIGYESGKVNVYYVKEVNFGDGWATTNGVWCQDDVVVLGGETRSDLLSHEFGHAMMLNHVSGSSISETNVMWDLSVNRRYFTEGQTFRAHVSSTSVINRTYNLRPGAEVHDCNDSEKCPGVEFRIWNDG